MKDEIEILASQATEVHPRDVRKILDELPVEQRQDWNAVMDSAAEKENDVTEPERAKTLVAYTAALFGALVLTVAVGAVILIYLR